LTNHHSVAQFGKMQQPTRLGSVVGSIFILILQTKLEAVSHICINRTLYHSRRSTISGVAIHSPANFEIKAIVGFVRITRSAFSVRSAFLIHF